MRVSNVCYILNLLLGKGDYSYKWPLYHLSEPLQKFTGHLYDTRQNVIKSVSNYISDKKLNNGKHFLLDDKLKSLFEDVEENPAMIKLSQYLNPHLLQKCTFKMVISVSSFHNRHNVNIIFICFHFSHFLRPQRPVVRNRHQTSLTCVG